MSLRENLKILGERWLIVVFCAVLGLAGATAAHFLRPAEYTAGTSLFVSSQIINNPQDAFEGARLSQDRVTSYVELVTSDRVLGDASRQLGLAPDGSDLADRVDTTSSPSSVIIGISVTDPSAELAAQYANGVAEATSRVVAELERPRNDIGGAFIAARVIQPATIPTAPSSPGLSVLAGLGLLVGLSVGALAAFVRNTVDNTITSEQEAAETVAAPVLGAVVLDPDISQQPLVLHDSPHKKASEHFRKIRTNLQFIDVDSPRKVIVITSAAPGEGKSTTACNVAVALASAGRRVLLIEADLRRPGISAMLGTDPAVGLTTVLSGGLRLGRAVQNWGGGLLDVLPSGILPPNPGELLSSNQMRSLIREARESYDFVLIDTPPVLPVADAVAVAPATDGTVLVCRYGRTAASDVAGAAQSVRAVSGSVLGVILTMVPVRRSGGGSEYDVTYAAPSTPRVQLRRADGISGPARAGAAGGAAAPMAGDPERTARVRRGDR